MTDFLAWLAPAVLAVVATAASYLLLQFALLVAWPVMSAALLKLRSLAPYALLALLLPGGLVVAFLLWLHRRQKGPALLGGGSLIRPGAWSGAGASDQPRACTRRLLHSVPGFTRLPRCAFEFGLAHEQFQKIVDGFHDRLVLLIVRMVTGSAARTAWFISRYRQHIPLL
jgi:hypothetical protein